MTTLTFYKLSENFLLKLADSIENSDPNSIFDVEYSDGILTIAIHESGQEYVINRHNANQKIWYSSPISGADYFSFDESKQQWLNADSIELEAKLKSELENFK